MPQLKIQRRDVVHPVPPFLSALVIAPQRNIFARHAGSPARAVLVLAGGSMMAGAVADDGSFALPEAMRSGMTLRDLIFPLNDSAPGESTRILRADQAEIRDEPNLLWITGMRFSSGGGANPFQLDATSATYDFASKAIRTRGGFQAEGFGFSFEGAELQGDAKTLCFDVPEHLEIRMRGFPAPLHPSGPARQADQPPLHAPVHTAFAFPSIEAMSPLRMVQDFAGNLHTFSRCWRWVEHDESAQTSGSFGASTLVAPGGGRIDLKRNELRLDGASAMLGPRAILISDGGIGFRQDETDGDSMTRVRGQGGIQGWMKPPRSGETLIQSETFEYVSDGQVLQFEGGPLVVHRDGMILQAVESWQFLRVFEGERIVLSPGNWNMTGKPVALND